MEQQMAEDPRMEMAREASGLPFGMDELPEIVPPVDLSQAQPADGPSLLPDGVHADGTLCYHGIAQDAPVVIDGGRWRTCRDSQQVLVQTLAGSPELGKDGWELTKTPCPACGAPDEVLVRQQIATAGEDGKEPDGPWEFFCRTCGASGPAHPKAGA
jgi:hypothetical protein